MPAQQLVLPSCSIQQTPSHTSTTASRGPPYYSCTDSDNHEDLTITVISMSVKEVSFIRSLHARMISSLLASCCISSSISSRRTFLNEAFSCALRNLTSRDRPSFSKWLSKCTGVCRVDGNSSYKQEKVDLLENNVYKWGV